MPHINQERVHQHSMNNRLHKLNVTDNRQQRSFPRSELGFNVVANCNTPILPGESYKNQSYKISNETWDTTLQLKTSEINHI